MSRWNGTTFRQLYEYTLKATMSWHQKYIASIQSEVMALGPPRIRLKNGEMNVVGNRVSESRQKAVLTQDQLCGRIADITHGKWMPTRKDIYRIESGTRLVSDLELIAISMALSREARWLLFGDAIETFGEVEGNIFQS